MADMTELLPCPFCGGKARHIRVQEDGPLFNGECIECEKCKAASAIVFPCMDNIWRELCEKWNLRALTDPALAELDAKATQGEWHQRESIDGDWSITTEARAKLPLVPIAEIETGFDDPFESEQLANMAFIVALVTAYRRAK